MAIRDIIKNIEVNFDRIKDEDFSLLFVDNPNIQNWNNMDKDEIKEYFEDTMDVFKNAIDNNLLKTISSHYLNNINTYLNNFIAQYQSLKNISPNSITTQHHQPLNQILNINNIFRNTGVYSIVKLSPDIDKKNEIINTQIQNANSAQQELNTLTEQVRNLLNPAVAGALSNAFDVRRKQVAIQKWVWLFILLLSIAVAAYITHDVTEFFTNLVKNNNDNTNPLPIVWFFRILILFPTYFLVGFSFSQYNKERSFEENYAHKATIAQTLPSYSELVVNNDMKDQITSSATKVAFSPPQSFVGKDNKGKELTLSEAKEIYKYLGELIPNINNK